MSTYSRSEPSRVVMLVGRAGAGSERLKSMHLVLLAVKAAESKDKSVRHEKGRREREFKRKEK